MKKIPDRAEEIRASLGVHIISFISLSCWIFGGLFLASLFVYPRFSSLFIGFGLILVSGLLLWCIYYISLLKYDAEQGVC